MVRSYGLSIFIGFLLTGSFSLGADQLPGNKFFLVSSPQSGLPGRLASTSTAAVSSVNMLSWTEFDKTPPIPPERYNRAKQFGTWIDPVRDTGCLTIRGIVLAKTSLGPVTTYPDAPCYIASGKWYDPYTERTFTDARDVQIDHVVPLKNAYISGAFRWPWQVKCAYFNFIGNSAHLLPIDSRTNRDKSDKSIEEWTPPSPRYQCQYVANWLKIKTVWNLMMSEAEVQMIARIVQEHRCDPRLYKMDRNELLRQRSIINELAQECVLAKDARRASAQ